MRNVNTVFIFNGFDPKLDDAFIDKMIDLNEVEVIRINNNDEDPVSYIKSYLQNKNTARISGSYVICTSNIEIFNKAFSNNVVELKRDCVDYPEKQHKLLKQFNWIFNNGKKPDKDIFIIGDPHFSHKNIIKYCNRPWNSGYDSNGEIIISNEDVERMNDALISNWNSVVSDDDIVIVNGDFALGDRMKIPEIVSRLNGHKKLILGNHDHFHFNSEMKKKYKDIVDFYLQAGFERVIETPIIIQDFIIISHAPMQWITSKDPYANIYAHVHTQDFYKDYTCNTFCTSAERIGYTPIRLSKIIETWKSFN